MHYSTILLLYTIAIFYTNNEFNESDTPESDDTVGNTNHCSGNLGMVV